MGCIAHPGQHRRGYRDQLHGCDRDTSLSKAEAFLSGALIRVLASQHGRSGTPDAAEELADTTFEIG